MAKNVFVCDDAPFMRMVIKDILGKNGYTVVGEADNGKAAVAQYRALSPDLVLMDIAMPEMDGLAALRQILKIDAGAKVVMCGSTSQQGQIDEALRLGAKGFVEKPFDQRDVLQVLRRVAG